VFCNSEMTIFRFNAHLVFLLARDIRETLASVHSDLKDAVIDAEVLPVATTWAIQIHEIVSNKLTVLGNFY